MNIEQFANTPTEYSKTAGFRQVVARISFPNFNITKKSLMQLEPGEAERLARVYAGEMREYRRSGVVAIREWDGDKWNIVECVDINCNDEENLS